MEIPPNQSDSDLDSVRAYWDDRAARHESDCDKVECSHRAQRMRFEAFVLFHDLEGKSILDVGCGVGDLWQHLKQRQIECDYTGVDLSPQMISRCRERYPEAHFEHQNILEWGEPRQFDYTVSIGIHNIRFENGWQILERVTQRQFELCRVAAHVSLLTDRYKGFAPHIQPWKVEEVLTLALNITPYVVVRHDYLPNDFSITLYREPLIDTRTDLMLD